MEKGSDGIALNKNSSPKRNGTSDKDEDWSEVPFWTSQRFITACILFWGFACLYMQRVNLSIAMVCMIKVENTTYEATNSSDYGGAYDTNNSNGDVEVVGLSQETATSLPGIMSTVMTTAATTMKALAPGDSGYCESLGLKSTKDDTGEFTWSKPLQGLILGSFFWGYLVLQIPGGIMSERLGPKRVMFYTMLPVAILGLLSPLSARISPWLFLVVRVLVGVGEGAMYPAAQALWARWSPPSERSRLVSFSMSGGQFGNAMIFPISGFLCASLGWDSVFYSMGAMGLAWCIVCFFFVADSPALNKRISPLERKYIQHHVTFRDNQKKSKIPWGSIMTSLPFWAILMGHTCGNYGLYMLLTQMPTYMKEVLKFDLKSNGLYSMLPYLTMWFCIAGAGILSDVFITRNILSRGWTRKLMGATGLILPAVCIAGLTFMDCTQQILAVVMLCGTVGLSGIAFAGYMVNHGDISPRFAGTLFGITNLSATVPGIIAPYVVGAITTNKTREEWQVAFFIAAAIYAIGGVFYLVFASGETQPWGEVDSSQDGDVEGTESLRMMDKGNSGEGKI